MPKYSFNARVDSAKYCASGISMIQPRAEARRRSVAIDLSRLEVCRGWMHGESLLLEQ